MARKKIGELIEQLTGPFFQEHGYELFHTEFVKEGKDWFLRVYIDKIVDGSYVSVSTDDCEIVSRYLSQRLDEEDPIEQNYYLEVSSPGLDRPLLSEKDYIRFAGEPVEVSLYKAFEGKKTWNGRLIGKQGGFVTIQKEEGGEIALPEEQISKVRLEVIF